MAYFFFGQFHYAYGEGLFQDNNISISRMNTDTVDTLCISDANTMTYTNKNKKVALRDLGGMDYQEAWEKHCSPTWQTEIFKANVIVLLEELRMGQR